METETLKCPHVYDTGKLFDGFHNERTDTKCFGPYTFIQGGKLEYGNAKNNQMACENDEYAIQVRTGINGPGRLRDVTGANIGERRTIPGIQSVPLTTSGRHRPFTTLNNTNQYYPTQNETTDKEKFIKEFGDGCAFTTMPSPISAGTGSAHGPQDRWYGPYGEDCCNNSANQYSDVEKDFNEIGKKYKNTAVKKMTMGDRGEKEEFFAPGFCNCNGWSVFGVVAAVVLFIGIIFAIAIAASNSSTNAQLARYVRYKKGREDNLWEE